jgi:D-alanine transaminase
MNTVYLNGQYLPDHDARISVYDRGFLFGDGVYEVLPIYNGRLHHFAEHIARLHRSLDAIRINAVRPESEWQQIAQTLLQKNQLTNASLYLQVTRGGAVGKRDHAFTTPTTPSVFAFVQKWAAPETPIDQRGVSAITVTDNRWHRCDIKAITLLANALARQQACDAGVDEAIFVRDDNAIEGSSSNLFAIINNTLITAPESPLILSGITRHVILTLAQQHNWTVQLRALTRQELLVADEVWISSSLREIKAVVRVDEMTIGDGKTGPRYQQMMQWFRAEAMSPS